MVYPRSPTEGFEGTLKQGNEVCNKMDQTFPLSFAYCKWSKTGQWEGLGTRISQAHYQKTVPRSQSIISVNHALWEWVFLFLHQKTALDLADEEGHMNVSEFLKGAGVSVDLG